MFGRLDEDSELSREYMLIKNDVYEPEYRFLYGSPEEIKSLITMEIEARPLSTWNVWELVEFVEVEADGECVFIEDHGSIEDFIACESVEELREMELADEPEDS